MNFTQAEVRAQLSSHSSDYSFGWPALPQTYRWTWVPGPASLVTDTPWAPMVQAMQACPPGATRLVVFHGEEEGCRRSG